MNNQKKDFVPSPRTTAQSKYNIARSNLLLALAFTAINIVLILVGADLYFLFSATIPRYAAVIGVGVAAQTGMTVSLVIFGAIAIVLTLPYLICWIFSKKHYGWMIGALIYFSLDTAVLVLFLLMGDFTPIVDILIHAWVLYYLILGVKNGLALKSLPEEDPIIDFTSTTEE